MSNVLVESLSVSFDADSLGALTGGNNKIVLQQMTHQFDYLGQLWARCFPSSGVTFICNRGTVRPGEVKTQVIHEGLKFSDSDTAELRFPYATDVILDDSFPRLKKITKADGSIEIVESNATLTFDQDSNSVIASEAIYGGCTVAYRTSYQMLYYVPYSLVVAGGWFGMSWATGTIFGYKGAVVEMLEMELEIDKDSDWIEFCRVVSKIVLDPDGTHEAPIGWPTTSKFSGLSTKELDPYNSFTDERVHAIVNINNIGSLRYESYNNGGKGYSSWFDPMFGKSTWNPSYEVKYSTPPTNEPNSKSMSYSLSSWQKVFTSVNKGQLEDDLKKRYPGLVTGTKGGNL